MEFENRRFRWEIEGLGEVMPAAASRSGDGTMVLVGKSRGVPIYEVRTTRAISARFWGDSSVRATTAAD